MQSAVEADDVPVRIWPDEPAEANEKARHPVGTTGLTLFNSSEAPVVSRLHSLQPTRAHAQRPHPPRTPPSVPRAALTFPIRTLRGRPVTSEVPHALIGGPTSFFRFSHLVQRRGRGLYARPSPAARMRRQTDRRGGHLLDVLEALAVLAARRPNSGDPK